MQDPDDPQFVILKHTAWMSVEKFESKILGAIVKEHLKPSNNYVGPVKYKPEDFDFLENKATNFVLDHSNSTSEDASAKLKSIGGFQIHGAMSEAYHLKGKLIRWKRFTQVDNYWSLMVKDATVKSKVPRWVSLFNSWPPCLVVGIMICEDVEVSTKEDQSREIIAEIEIPVSAVAAAAGAPNLLGDTGNPELSAASTLKKANIFKAKIGESSIFAIELQKITTPFLRTEQLHLNKRGPHIDLIRGAGPSDDDGKGGETDADHDLTLDGFTDEEYALMTV